MSDTVVVADGKHRDADQLLRLILRAVADELARVDVLDLQDSAFIRHRRRKIELYVAIGLGQMIFFLVMFIAQISEAILHAAAVGGRADIVAVHDQPHTGAGRDIDLGVRYQRHAAAQMHDRDLVEIDQRGQLLEAADLVIIMRIKDTRRRKVLIDTLEEMRRAVDQLNRFLDLALVLQAESAEAGVHLDMQLEAMVHIRCKHCS